MPLLPYVTVSAAPDGVESVPDDEPISGFVLDATKEPMEIRTLQMPAASEAPQRMKPKAPDGLEFVPVSGVDEAERLSPADLERRTCLLIATGSSQRIVLWAVDRLEHIPRHTDSPQPLPDAAVGPAELIGLGISIHRLAVRSILRRAKSRLGSGWRRLNRSMLHLSC